MLTNIIQMQTDENHLRWLNRFERYLTNLGIIMLFSFLKLTNPHEIRYSIVIKVPFEINYATCNHECVAIYDFQVYSFTLIVLGRGLVFLCLFF
jgi:hypothetical protein